MDSRIRSFSAEALGKLGDRKALPLLEELLDDSSKNVRIMAKEAISKLKAN